MVYLARGRRLARSSSSFFVLVGRLQPVASYRFSRYVLLRPMILKRYARTIKKGWSYQGKLISVSYGTVLLMAITTACGYLGLLFLHFRCGGHGGKMVTYDSWGIH